MTIHSEHPFATPEGERSPLRRFRGRLPAPVSVWTAAVGGRRAGWTLTSFLLADGAPAEVLGVLDEDSELAELLATSATVVVNLLAWSQRGLADAFAGVAPAPGGAFRLAEWVETEWGPALEGGLGWLGARLQPVGERAGWGLLVRATIEHVELEPAAEEAALMHVRSRYRSLS